MLSLPRKVVLPREDVLSQRQQKVVLSLSSQQHVVVLPLSHAHDLDVCTTREQHVSPLHHDDVPSSRKPSALAPCGSDNN